jgi:hypothetical protein
MLGKVVVFTRENKEVLKGKNLNDSVSLRCNLLSLMSLNK